MAKAANGGSGLDIKKIRELVKLVEDSGIEELEVGDGDTTIRIQKSSGMMMSAPSVISAAAMAAPAASPLPALVNEAAGGEAGARSKWRDVRSPIVGTFYRSSSPTTPAFVSVGDKVKVGQPLCIVEAMKVMNEIEAEFSGTIKEVLLEDAMPVEAEGVMFLVEPD
ncbi:MAG: acetyl-CoA carboxylase biotin carboxyl carrier protein [Candidatus Krumholzibacteriia bacterium]|jgi:acetyl-CoA carboxylase biotin carboxyl carrier protein